MTAVQPRTPLVRVPKAIFSVHLARIAALIVFSVVFVRTAWICDDAFITMRVVDNFVNGYGLVWNTDERVQAYTHPLWLLLLLPVYFVVREPYYVLLAVSAALSAGAVVLVLRAARAASLVLLAGILLTGSKAFVDFSTSGLENPLSHLLLAAFGLLYIRARWQATSRYDMAIAALAGLAILNRFDLALLVLPAVAERILSERTWNSRIRLAVITLSPAVLWMVFSLLYYGFPFPNTYYAKQASGVSRSEYLERGIAYLIKFAANDLLSFVTIVVALALGFKNARSGLLSLAIGQLLYMAYIIWIGGDFMQGRLFSPLFVSTIVSLGYVLLRLCIGLSAHATCMAAALALGLLTYPIPTWLSSYPYPPAASWLRLPSGDLLHALIRALGYPKPFMIDQITDDRGSYFQSTGLLSLLISGPQMESHWAARGGKNLRQLETRVTVLGAIGLTGFYAGPKVRIIDHFALADAFLARLPYRDRVDWRVGHLIRHPPDGYVASRLYDQNRLSGQMLRQLYEDIRLVTRGPLLSRERLAAIVRLNLHPPKIPESELDLPVRDFALSQMNRQVVLVPSTGLTIYMTAYRRPLPESLLFLSDAATTYQLTFTNDWREAQATSAVSPARLSHRSYALSPRLLDLSSSPAHSFNLIKVEALNPTHSSRIGYLRLLDETTIQRNGVRGSSVPLLLTQGHAVVVDLPARVMQDGMVGVWRSEAEFHELRVRLASISCDRQERPTAELFVNDYLAHRFMWDDCRSHQEFVAQLTRPIVRKGWNLLEVRVSRPGSIEVQGVELHPSRAS
ncbi:MAG: hypothetical protein RML99_06580 [Anaerolineae bacterium]|nr:hypothetical protein [Anaerolineae bacterium]